MSLPHRLPRSQALLDAIDGATPIALSTRVYRVVAAGRDPLLPGRAGGRWDDGTFDVLYTSSARDGACAECWFYLSQGQPIPPSKPERRLYQIEIDLQRVLDLSGEGRLAALGVDMSNYGKLSYVQRAAEYPTTQQIGEVAFFYEYQAVVVPNARWPTSNVVIITEHAGPARVSADDGESIDLSQWRASRRARSGAASA